MKKISFMLLAGLAASVAGSLQAQDILTNPTYITGNGFVTDNFNPSSIPSYQLLDNGVAPDVAAGDGIYSVRITGAPNTGGFYKAASAGFSAVNTPDAGFDNLVVNSGPTGVVDFFLNLNLTAADGFSPSTGVGQTIDGVVYSSYNLEVVNSSDDGNLRFVGSFQSELGGDDYTTGTGAVVLSDVDNDDIYTGTATGIPAGNYAGKFTIGTAGFGKPAFGTAGLIGGNDINFTVTAPTDIINFSLNAVTGRHRIQNAAAVAGPPFYAQSAPWGTAFTSVEDLGTAVAGVYSKVFTVATPGEYTLRVTDTAGNRYPSSGSGTTAFCPFVTTTPNQQVRVVFDTNTYNDGYAPADNFVLVTDATTRETLVPVAGIQFAGSFQADFNQSGFGVPDTNFQAASIGDGIWAFTSPIGTFTNTSSTPGGFGYKAVFALGTTPTQPANYDYQIGGNDDGFTRQANNGNVTPLTYGVGDFVHGKADVRTGRIRMQSSTTATPNPIANPQRNGAYLPAAAEVENWMMHSF
ncbi:MAG: choice-of-anchor X domain-containing protein [Candidatus Sumerlaeia bacterium]|nr:choice-of-anchor X domain-containing protein [Candidatus Sumerlaeia bacterium]